MKRRWTTLRSLAELAEAQHDDEQARKKAEYDRKKDRKRNRPERRNQYAPQIP